MDKRLKKARELTDLLDLREKDSLSSLACLSSNAVKRRPEPRAETEYRQSFSVDADRILNSLAYTRYIDKTQVFSLIKNDHLTHRVLHVQLVSRVARTIGRYLKLNQDLIEAASLGHDIGHPPFGHDGENFLSKLTVQHGAGAFLHNLQSVQFLDRIEKKGSGWNLSLQVLDAILCHNGEASATSLIPRGKSSFKTFDSLMKSMKQTPASDPLPMTLEGCVVRLADTVSYLGRDLEDAVRLGLITREQLPKDCRTLLGKTNGTIVFNLVTDLIHTSAGQNFIGFSSPVAGALHSLKAFNYRAIYKNPVIKEHLSPIEDIFKYLFDKYLFDLSDENRSSVIFTEFLDGMDPSYGSTHSPAEIVRDFISGMTDSYFISQAPGRLKPEYINYV